MKRLLLILLSASACATGLAPASQASATLIEKQYQTAMETWVLQIRVAATLEARNEAIQKRPDLSKFAREMWDAIDGSLKEDWTLEPAAWFLRITSNLHEQKPDGNTVPAFMEETGSIRKAVETYHANSPKLSPMCLALTAGADPRSLALLEKIATTNPDQRVQGTAALSAAMILKTIGDSPEIMKKRLTFLRKAIIQSADVEVNGASVSKLAEDELYIIRYLTKGRVAPDLKGVDSSGKSFTLSDYRGKVVVLLFWNTNVLEPERVLQFAAGMNDKFKGRPFALIGVNNDPTEKLRSLQADGTVTWQNFSDPQNALSGEYRIGSWPLAYVLDADGKIHFAGVPGSFVELTAEALLTK